MREEERQSTFRRRRQLRNLNFVVRCGGGALLLLCRSEGRGLAVTVTNGPLLATVWRLRSIRSPDEFINDIYPDFS